MTMLLNLMTLTIGLSTMACFRGITKMAKEFRVSNLVGQVELFIFNISVWVRHWPSVIS